MFVFCSSSPPVLSFPPQLFPLPSLDSSQSSSSSSAFACFVLQIVPLGVIPIFSISFLISSVGIAKVIAPVLAIQAWSLEVCHLSGSEGSTAISWKPVKRSTATPSRKITRVGRVRTWSLETKKGHFSASMLMNWCAGGGG